MSLPNTATIKKLYGPNDLSCCPAFQGGYINFGYWKDIDISNDKLITLEERIIASASLYNRVFAEMNLQGDDSVLEIGCGRGHGCASLLKRFNPKKVCGLDITPEQIERAKEIHASLLNSQSNLTYKNASIDQLLETKYYTKIFAVESAQHFPSIEAFAKEAYRLLQDQGLLVIAAHFATNPEGFEATRKATPLIDQGIDSFFTLEQVKKGLQMAGFTELKTIPIGEHVFKGLNQWLTQADQTPWGFNLLTLYERKNIDYYIFVFTK